MGYRCPHHSEGAPTPEEGTSAWKQNRGVGGYRWHLIQQCRRAYRRYQELSGTPPGTFAARVKNRIETTEDQLELAKRSLTQARLICGEILRYRESKTKERLTKTKSHQTTGDIQRLHDLLAGKESWKTKANQGNLPGI